MQQRTWTWAARPSLYWSDLAVTLAASGLIQVMTPVTLSEPVQGDLHLAPDFWLNFNAAAVRCVGSTGS